MKVECEIAVYEEDGKNPGNDPHEFFVRSHWNERNKVVISYKGNSVTVLGDELKAAVDNAMNKGTLW